GVNSTEEELPVLSLAEGRSETKSSQRKRKAFVSTHEESVQIKSESTLLTVEDHSQAEIEPLAQPQWRTESKTSVSTPSLPVLAMNSDEPTSDDPLKLRPKIKTVGDLVNFVVSKVDKRKNKIIEFSKEDDGEVISGFNLGVVQYQTQNK